MEAAREFERARALSPDYPGYWVGDALLSMVQEDFWRARQDLAKAIHRDGKFTDAYVALGRVIAAEGLARSYPVEAWYQEALEAYRKAESSSPGDPKVGYYLGLCHFDAGKLEPARAAFSQLIGAGHGRYLALAQEQLAKVQLIERVAPGSAWGMKIARLPQISRAELAVLLVEELRIAELVTQRRLPDRHTRFAVPGQVQGDSATTPTDLAASWARPWILQVLQLGIPGLEVTPDHRFQPEAKIDRAAMAVVTHGILVLLTGDEDLATRYLGETSRFPDVRSDSYAYNAIAVCAERGIITADHLTGLFHPGVYVSGAEAMEILRLLQNAVRFEF
ncbi:MAG: S-layer homology domain-containing protein [Candidatus Latescibacteria bacterium]|nr:S-layer homology domain-containing protein [Candidatus Latescibacterota bacterium]